MVYNRILPVLNEQRCIFRCVVVQLPAAVLDTLEVGMADYLGEGEREKREGEIWSM
jgi:hypothetical protein